MGFSEGLSSTLHLHCPVSESSAACSLEDPHDAYISPFSTPFRRQKTLDLNLSTVLGIFNPKNVLKAIDLQSHHYPSKIWTA